MAIHSKGLKKEKGEKNSEAYSFPGRPGSARAIAFAIVVLLLSGVYLGFAYNRYRSIATREAIILAESLESLLHTEHIAELIGSAEDLQKPEYIITKESLISLVETINPIRFAYLLGERKGNLVFLLDSETPDSPGYSPPGQIYSEAANVYREPFRTGKTAIADRKEDRWGTWVSILVPVTDPVDGSVVAVFVIDYDAAEWYRGIRKHMIPDIIIVLSILMLLTALVYSLFQRNTLKKLSEKLAFDEALYHNVFKQAPIGIAIVNNKNFVVRSQYGSMNINPMFERILGRTGTELSEVQWTEITHPEDLAEDLDKFDRFQSCEINGYSMEKRFLKPDGSSVWTHMKIVHLLGGDQKFPMHLCLLEDISARKASETNLKESERSKSVLLSNLPGMAYRCKYDYQGTMLYVSAGCYHLTGYLPESFLNNKDLAFNDIITPGYRNILLEEWNRTVPNKLPYKCEYEIITAHGQHKWVLEMGEGVYDDEGEVEALEGIILDISDRKEMEDILKYNSEHDMWTGLYNRRYLEDLLKKDSKSEYAGKSALVSINLTGVNSLSLIYGFHYSRDLIKKAAESLSELCSEKHRLFNTYENRFVFYIKDYEADWEVPAFCEAVAQRLDVIFSVERVSIGIGVIEIQDHNRHDIGLLLKNLLVASEKAIDSMETDVGICFFDSEVEAQILREEAIIRELDQIAAQDHMGGLYLQYQPILELATDRICGFEALARLNSDKLGLVMPMEFIPLAEKTKLILPLGEKLLLCALGFLRQLKEKGLEHVSISVNISAIQLLRRGFAERLFEMIEEMGVNPERLCIEITETVFASNYQEINIILSKFRQMGINIAIDDFGTEYSSLARERELNVTCLKIDRYFIDKLLKIDPEQAITGDIISMAHKLGHCVTAEGVEEERQLKYLRDHGCDKIQGYLISKPVDEEEALAFLSTINDEDCL